LPPSESAAAAYRGRQARLAEWLQRGGLFACVLEDNETARASSVRWLTGHPMDAMLFVFASGTSVLVPWDANMAAERAVAGQVIPSTEFKRSSRDTVKAVLNDHGAQAAVAGPRARRKIGFPARTSHLRFQELAEDLPGAEVVTQAKGFEEWIARTRTVKDAAEIQSLEKAAAITNDLIDLIDDRLRRDPDGLREIDLAQLIERESLARGAEGLGFETLAAGPSRSWGIHAFPACSAGPFAGPGLSILDFGIRFDGYTSDVTLTVARGRLTEAQARMVSLVEEAYDAAMAAVKPGASPQEPARRVDRVFEAAGARMPHGLGHGIGLDAHEDPGIRSLGDPSDPALLPGMVFTIEPGLYDHGEGGVRKEDDVLVTETGARVLTRTRIIRIP
jgi:Xaa-Pro dipeptidase